MRPDAETVGNRFEDFLFLVDAAAGTPPPGLMNERPVRGVHEADNAVVDRRGQVGPELGKSVLGAEDRQARRRWRRLIAVGGIRQVHPQVAVSLLAGKVPGIDAIHFELVARRQGRDGTALTGPRVESPAVILAFNLVPVEITVGERYAAVRAIVAERPCAPLAVATEHQRLAQKHRLLDPLTAHLVTAQRRVPEAAQHGAVRALHFIIHTLVINRYYKRMNQRL